MSWFDDRTGHEAWVVGYAPRVDPRTRLTHYDVEEMVRGQHGPQLVQLVSMACDCGWRSTVERVVFTRPGIGESRAYGVIEPATLEWDGCNLASLAEFDENKLHKHWKTHLDSIETPTDKDSFGRIRFDEPARKSVVESFRHIETRLILVIGERFTRGIEPMAAIAETERNRGQNGRGDLVFGLRPDDRDMAIQVLRRLVASNVVTVTESGRLRITHEESWLSMNAPRVINMRDDRTTS